MNTQLEYLHNLLTSPVETAVFYQIITVKVQSLLTGPRVMLKERNCVFPK